MNKIAELKGDLATKQQVLNDKKIEVRAFVDDADKTTDEVKAGMSDIKDKEAEIEKLKEEIAVLEQAAGLETTEEDADEKETEQRADDPDNVEEPSDDELGADEDPDTETRNGEGIMKVNVLDAKNTTEQAFETFLKTGEKRDVTGLALSDGAVIIPETILPAEHEENQFPRLGQLIRNVTVKTTTGKLPVFDNTKDTLKAHTEYSATAVNKASTITPVKWDLQTYTGAYVFSQELISDSAYDWQGELQGQLIELRDNTDDGLIMTALTTGITPVVSEDFVADLKTALNVNLKPADKKKASIVLSQSAYNALDQIKDDMERPMLQPSIASATGELVLGKQVIVVEDTLFPKAKEGDINAIVAPLKKAVINFKLAEITGQFQDTHDIWYKQLGIFLRENVVQARKDVIINIKGSQEAVNASAGSNTTDGDTAK
ncbi:phage major capsid protein [Weissella cibaria]|uniref:phage major capsid protein n=1 Tax=Weissella cibaria TaxID=137591 RepID=UPI0021C1D466|nr:phage major capsid protein [Weissella cibaria]MCT8399728.1 phage major capsid protein [Weissella cibaria]